MTKDTKFKEWLRTELHKDFDAAKKQKNVQLAEYILILFGRITDHFMTEDWMEEIAGPIDPKKNHE
jgi:hypothetical protein